MAVIMIVVAAVILLTVFMIVAPLPVALLIVFVELLDVVIPVMVVFSRPLPVIVLLPCIPTVIVVVVKDRKLGRDAPHSQWSRLWRTPVIGC